MFEFQDSIHRKFVYTHKRTHQRQCVDTYGFFFLSSFIRSAFGFVEEHLTEVKICGVFFSRAHIDGKMFTYRSVCVDFLWKQNFQIESLLFLCAYRPMADLSLVGCLFLPLLNYFHSFLPTPPPPPSSTPEWKKKSVFKCVNLGIHRKIVTITRFIHTHTKTHNPII